MKAMIEGKERDLEGGEPSFVKTGASSMRVRWPLKTMAGQFELDLDEKTISVRWVGTRKLDWFLELRSADGAVLPFEHIADSAIDCRFEGMSYQVLVNNGLVSRGPKGAVFRMAPEKGLLVMRLGPR